MDPKAFSCLGTHWESFEGLLWSLSKASGFKGIDIDSWCKSGWWFEPLWKIWVTWDDYSQYMEKSNSCSKPPTRNDGFIFDSQQSTISDWAVASWRKGPNWKEYRIPLWWYFLNIKTANIRMTQPEKKKRDGATPFDQVDLQLPVETIHLKFVPCVHQWWGVVPRDRLGYDPNIFSPDVIFTPLLPRNILW